MINIRKFFNQFMANGPLIMAFSLGDIKNKYRNSVLGFSWSLIEPLLLFSVLYFVFNSIFENDIENFAIYLLLGIVFWNFIKNSTSSAVVSITYRQTILSSVFFHRYIPAISANITGLIILGFELIIFAIFMVVTWTIPTVSIIMLPVLLALLFVITIGISLPLSVLHVYYKDVQFIWNILIMVGFFAHPILYSLDILPDNIKNILIQVPTVRLFDMIQNSVLYDSFPNVLDFTIVTVTSIIIFGVGYAVYKHFSLRLGEQF